jgi:hypothetical protein
VQELHRGAQYRDRRFEGTDTEYFKALDESCTVYIGNLAFATREEQLYEVCIHLLSKTVFSRKLRGGSDSLDH